MIRCFKTVRLLVMAVIVVTVLPVMAEQSDVGPKSAAVKPEPEKPLPADASSVKSPPQDFEPAIRFTPSEKLRADDAVSFPVDI